MKIASVQYLRALAALLVVLTHALAYQLAERSQVSLRLGLAGVTLFFVISGFIIVLICGPGPFNARDFLWRRIVRVVPMYWLATLAVAAIALFLPQLLKHTEFDLRQLVLSLLFVPHYRANGELVPLLKLGWTLNMEMFFYISFSLLAVLTTRMRVTILSILFILLTIIGLTQDFVHPILHAYTRIHLLSFTLGMWIGLATLEKRLPSDRTWGWTLFAMAGGLFLWSFAASPTELSSPLVVLLQTLAAGLLLLAGLVAEPRMPHWRPGLLLGDASYSTYLVHMYVVAATLLLCVRLMPGLPLGIVSLIAFTGSTAAGVLAHLLVEKPIMRLFRRPSPAASGQGSPPATA